MLGNHSLHDRKTSEKRRIGAQAGDQIVAVGVKGQTNVRGRGRRLGMRVGMKDGPERPALPAKMLHRIELLSGLHLVSDRRVKGIGDGKNGDRLPCRIRSD
jgi:hypothetical protein